MNQKRIRTFIDGKLNTGPVVYWMSRDQRVQDNWALLFAQDFALRHKKPLRVIFCLLSSFLNATLRQYQFMLEGLQETENTLEALNIPFSLLSGLPEKKVFSFIRQYKVAALITDFDPLRIKREWKEKIVKEIHIPFFEVDTHNIVPCWIASPKREYAAYTFRPKVQRHLLDFLMEFPKVRRHPIVCEGNNRVTDWKAVYKNLHVDRTVEVVKWIKAGEQEAQRALRDFIENQLSSYAVLRNDPSKDGQSNLSPYLHFGQLSAQRIVLSVQNSVANRTSQDAFLEELIVRRELSDNFCFYNPDYDKFDAFPDWSKKTLDAHRKDRREYFYSVEEFEEGRTHEPLWNTAQAEMIKSGKMHGYMRMYWAKKILEWTESPEKALEIAIYLNDKYGLDGRDPNGYTGIAWSIGGVHDRAWKERPVFGKIRYMSASGCKSKFNIKAYMKKVQSL